MESLFTFIGKYKQLENLNPQENYLTQLFAWILHQYPEYQLSFLRHIADMSKEEKLRITERAFEVNTQVPVTCNDGTRGFIDMVLENDELSIIFEHKIKSCLSDNQIEKYLTSDEYKDKQTVSILITYDKKQFEQNADICLTWRNVHQFTFDYINNGCTEPIILQFEKYFLESDMGIDTPFTIDDIKELVRNDFCYDSKLTRLFNWIEYDIKQEHEVVNQLRKINPDYVFYKGDHQRENRWGRIGIDCLSRESKYWNPGLFVGVICNGSDHGIYPIDSSTGPDFCVLLEMNINNPDYERFISSVEYKEMVNRIEGAVGDDYSIIEANELRWRILVLRKPFASIIYNYEDWNIQYESVKQAVLDGIKIIADNMN